MNMTGNIREQALKNIEEFVKSTPKEEIIARLKEISKVNPGGVSVSEVFAGCFDQHQFYYSYSSPVNQAIEKHELKNKLVGSVIVDPNPPNYEYSKSSTKTHKNVGFFIYVCLWTN